MEWLRDRAVKVLAAHATRNQNNPGKGGIAAGRHVEWHPLDGQWSKAQASETARHVQRGWMDLPTEISRLASE